MYHTTESASGSSSGAQNSCMLVSTPQDLVSQQNLTCSNITCREGFYCKEDTNNSVISCHPSCYTWNQHTPLANIAIDILVLMSACMGVVSGVGVLVVNSIYPGYPWMESGWVLHGPPKFSSPCKDHRTSS